MERTSWSTGLSVSADGVGVVAHAGSVGLRLLCDRVGLTAELSKAMVRGSSAPVYDRGRVLSPLAPWERSRAHPPRLPAVSTEHAKLRRWRSSSRGCTAVDVESGGMAPTYV